MQMPGIRLQRSAGGTAQSKRVAAVAAHCEKHEEKTTITAKIITMAMIEHTHTTGRAAQ
jgi:hypothetical protein